ncbi:MAG: LPS export ABC transporter ATP-binding protein [candidate division Zixibacteria bacterium]|nr:LPS export ABC transporter ATP-binding protein [candidate division Zixibacteria bacterium]
MGGIEPGGVGAQNGARLHTHELVKSYRGRRVVNGVTVTIAPGEIVGLLGPNGAGKTTTFYMTIGFIKPETGDVLLGERPITRLPMYKRARLGIGYLPQEPSIFRKMSVADNVVAVLEAQGLSRAERKKRLVELLEELNITHVAKNRGYQLSGGERRRVEIARALATRPKFMLLDEPFAGIDPIAVEDIQSIVAKLKQKGLGILITDHNVRETLSITDRAYIMCDGDILKEGTAEFLANDPEARKIYLGEKFRLN